MGSMTWALQGFWMGAQAETEPWIQNNVAPIHGHFSIYLFIYLYFYFGSTVASEKGSDQILLWKGFHVNLDVSERFCDYMQASAYASLEAAAVVSVYKRKYKGD